MSLRSGVGGSKKPKNTLLRNIYLVPKHETISRAENQRFESASLFIEKMLALYLKDLIELVK